MIQIDMEMPGHCEECPLNDEYAECALLGKVVAKCGRLPDCPLREVEEMTNVDEIKVGNVERERFMNRQKFREHLVKIGERIIKDAEEINFPSAMTTRMSVIASIAPDEEITEVHYIMHRQADPRLPEIEDEE